MSDQQTSSVPDSSAQTPVSDPSRVIRTYAQDLAVMQEKVTPEEATKQLKDFPKIKKGVAPVQTPPPKIPTTTNTPQTSADVSKTPPKEKPPEPEKARPSAPPNSVPTRNTPSKYKKGALARFFSELIGSKKKSTLSTKAPGPMAGLRLIPDMKPTEIPAQKSDVASEPTKPVPLVTPNVTTPLASIPEPLPPPRVPAPAPTPPTQAQVPPKPIAPPPKITAPEVVQKETVPPAVPVKPAEVFSPMPVPPTPESTYTPPEQNAAMVMPQAPPSLSTPLQTAQTEEPPIPLRTPEIPVPVKESREQLLARLHAKVAERGEATERLIEESVLPQAETPLPKMVPINNPAPVPSKENLSPLHTYKSDFSDHVNDTHASGMEILAAQQDAPRGESLPEKPVHNPYAVWFAVGGIIFLVVSVVGLLYAYRYNTHLSAPVATRDTAPTLIFVNGQKELSGTGITLQKALAHAATQPLAKNSMRLTYISIATTTLLGATTTVPGAGGYLIAALGLPIPDILMRNISLDSTVGVIHAGTQEAPFFIMRIASYDAAFAGMLRWERTMKHDFALLYPSYPATTPETSTLLSTSTATSTLGIASSTSSTSTTTSPTLSTTPLFVKAPTFVDKIIINHDVRVLYDSAGRSLLLYGFWNKHTIIVVRNAAAFIEIIHRLNNSNTQ